MHKRIRGTGLAALAIVAPMLLSACDDHIPAGTVTVKYGPEAAHAVHGCTNGQWSLQVLDAGGTENVGCVDPETAAKYAAGNAYP